MQHASRERLTIAQQGNSIDLLSQWDEITGVKQMTGEPKSGRFVRNRPYLIVLSGLHIGEMFPLDLAQEQLIGRGSEAAIHLLDEGISRRHAMLGPDLQGRLWVHDLGSRNGTFHNGRRIDRGLLTDGDKLQLGPSTMLRFAFQDEFDASFQRLMFDSALRDGLTRTFNKRYFNERLDAEFHFSRRHGTPLSLLLLDLDHFKDVNDTYGHVAGDYVLSKFATALGQNVRNEDVLARFGGEEFAIISRSISRDAASLFAERLRQMVEELHIEFQGTHIPLTMSVGVAAQPEAQADFPDSLIDAADKALLRAKRAGRNQVATYDATLDTGPLNDSRLEQDDTSPG